MADILATFTTKPIYCRDTAILPVKCLRSDGVTAINLTGATLRATLSRGAQILSTWVIAGGQIVVTDAPNGLANILFTTAQTDVGSCTLELSVVCIEADLTRTTVKGPLQFVEHGTI